VSVQPGKLMFAGSAVAGELRKVALANRHNAFVGVGDE
jgi:hypothetical protein